MLAILAKLSNLHIEIKRSEIFSGKKKLQKCSFFDEYPEKSLLHTGEWVIIAKN